MKNTSASIDRPPAVAGKFYSADPERLQKDLSDYFSSTKRLKSENVRAVMSPHAGYVFSGKIAASAFNQLAENAEYERIFVIGSSHHHSFGKAAVYCDGDFTMPYGTEKVDVEFGKKLTKEFPDLFTSNPEVHKQEHSIEVQLPFLHFKLKKDYTIVPIIIGTSDPSVCKKIATVLKPYLNADNLFVISTDFSHYPKYADAVKSDAATKDAIISNDPNTLMAMLAGNAAKHIPNLVTSLCGWTSVLTLMYMTAENDSIEYQPIEYCNSGDAEHYGERNRVVGYWSMAVCENQNHKKEFMLANAEKSKLLQIARKTIENKLNNQKKETIMPDELTSTLKTNCGAFVTIHKNGRLRGCIGRLTGNLPLYKMVEEMAVSAAFHDPRFEPLQKNELPDIEIEISALSPLKKISNISEIELGKHGVLIQEGYHSGVFLPQVATDTSWTKEEFLGHCARDKAGLSWDGWKNANLFIFTATVFSEGEHKSI
ncbi:MAG: AmmeMemoRadiSam system protein B [Paludibacter sp.]|nr:AmmeMemoRadiSam system protein B [Paludibacter sp.]